jgi:hypothetical protein
MPIESVMRRTMRHGPAHVKPNGAKMAKFGSFNGSFTAQA